MNEVYTILRPDTWDNTVQRLTGKPAYTVTFQVTENCNMACTYCYQNCKTVNSMNWDVAKITIDKIFQLSTDQYGTIIFDFIGGEPLLEIELIKKITKYTIDKMLKDHSSWLDYFRVSICSNGLAYWNQEVQDYFKKYKHFINFSISIDGNKELHDACRVDLAGNPTYEKAISAVKHYRKYYGTLNETKMTVSPNNVNYLYEALINLINEDYKFIHCNCIFEEGWEYFHAKILYNELKKVADYILDNNLNTKIYIRLFNENGFIPLEEDDENWCGGVCREGISDKIPAIKYDGQIFPCIRYMNSSLNNKQPELPIGNIYEDKISKIYQDNIEKLSNITRRSQSTDECFNCPIAAGCSWCSAYNYEKFGTPNKRATYICCMHKATSLANVYYWNKLYQKLNISKIFKMYLPKEEALKIIDENEYNYLLELIQKGEIDND